MNEISSSLIFVILANYFIIKISHKTRIQTLILDKFSFFIRYVKILKYESFIQFNLCVKSFRVS